MIFPDSTGKAFKDDRSGHDRALPVGHNAISELENLLYYYKQPLIISIVTSLQRCSQIFMESLLREYLINKK